MVRKKIKFTKRLCILKPLFLNVLLLYVVVTQCSKKQTSDASNGYFLLVNLIKIFINKIYGN